jgi:DNA ligase-1
MVTWGVKQVPTTTGLTDMPNNWEEFTYLLNRLENRSLTGNAARDAITACSQGFDSDQWNTVCVGVLQKDMRCGISEKTINKVVDKTPWEINTFDCQLATNCEDRPEMNGRKRLEPKLDGVRVLMYCMLMNGDHPVTIAMSRNGKEFHNFGVIQRELESRLPAIASKLNCNSFFLDGEIVGNTFQDLMKQARRKHDTSADDSVFHIFDYIPATDFTRGYWSAPQSKRSEHIKKLEPIIDDLEHVGIVPHIEVDLSTAEGVDIFNRYCKDQVEAGFEGVMIKAMDAPYVCKRARYWLKYKPTITVDLRVVDLEIGTGKNSGRLGALVCEGIDDGRHITVNVGSGLSEEQRDEFWQNKDQVVNRTVEILCDAVTHNQDGTYSLRFPRFLRFRDDK